MPSHTPRIEDYAMIGDCRSAALVGIDGSIDWLCWPRFDSPACFAALLGEPGNGRWLLAPKTVRKVSRHYRDTSLVLETEFEAEGGRVRVTDFMPVGDGQALMRRVTGLSGRVAMHTELVLRFDYGYTIPWVRRTAEREMTAVAGPHQVVLRSQVQLEGENMHSAADFEVGEGETVDFVLAYAPSFAPLPSPVDVGTELEDTEREWHDWAAQCRDGGPWNHLVRRSLMTLRALTYRPTGGIIAAATTSLPEKLGGERNWDYRYCWLRDASFTLQALMQGGYYGEAKAWRDWLQRAIAGSPEQLQILYGVAGERDLPERELPWLSGFGGSQPVRVGNAAAEQLQLDIFGEISDAMHRARNGGIEANEHGLSLRELMLEHLKKVWRKPDHGIWETRGGPQHFTYSKMMAWVAFDRAAHDRTNPVTEAWRDGWRGVADEVHAEICREAYDAELGCFVQHYGSRQTDAALLLLPIVGFLPADDPRIVGTIAAVEDKLLRDGLVLRYETETGIDGLPPGEGAFLACSFWLVDCYVLLGRLDEARALFERLAGLCNDVGLLAEEYDPAGRRMLGNFPQAFSHVALVNSAYRLARALEPDKTGG